MPIRHEAVMNNWEWPSTDKTWSVYQCLAVTQCKEGKEWLQMAGSDQCQESGGGYKWLAANQCP